MFFVYMSTEEPEWQKRYGNKSVSSLIYFITIELHIQKNYCKKQILNGKCHFCTDHEENINYLFYDCERSK